jgi:hypothetical protein
VNNSCVDLPKNVDLPSLRKKMASVEEVKKFKPDKGVSERVEN